MIVRNNNFNSRNFQVMYLIFTHTHTAGRQNNSVCAAQGPRGNKNTRSAWGQHEESGMPGCQPHSQNTSPLSRGSSCLFVLWHL